MEKVALFLSNNTWQSSIVRHMFFLGFFPIELCMEIKAPKVEISNCGCYDIRVPLVLEWHFSSWRRQVVSWCALVRQQSEYYQRFSFHESIFTQSNLCQTRVWHCQAINSFLGLLVLFMKRKRKRGQFRYHVHSVPCILMHQRLLPMAAGFFCEWKGV